MTFRSAQRAKIRLNVFAPVCSNSQVVGTIIFTRISGGVDCCTKGAGDKRKGNNVGWAIKNLSWNGQWNA